MIEEVPQTGTSSSRYTILGRLAGGGMADIYLAHASTAAGVERHVVLKRVLAEHSRNAQFAKMFLDEARLAAQLQHPNIAQVLDIGILAGSYFFTMEYVHGKDVRHLLHRLVTLQRQLPVASALHVAAGALAALHHAHERTGADNTPLGVVHRDVSPSNVMVSYEGIIKLLDFGVAKAAQNTSETRSGTIKGKISYLSPEQCRSAPVDRRSDIFALGIVLYEMLACRRLYRRDSDFATMEAIVHEPPRPLSSLRPEISRDLDRIVLRALAKDPADRFASAADMLEAIEDVAAREHHVLSATAMGRFMRELFGDRKEPWIELPPADEVTKMTITGESLAAIDAVDAQQLELEAQLEHAPLLVTGDASASDVDLSVPALTPTPPGPVADSPDARSRGSTILLGFVAALALAGGAVAVIHHMQTSPALAPQEPAGDAATPSARHEIAAGGSATAATAGFATTGSATTGSAGEASVGSASAGEASAGEASAGSASAGSASAGEAPSGAVSPRPTGGDAPAARTIAGALAAGDWIGALELCVARPHLADDDRARCGIAACNAKQKSVALGYHASVGSTAKASIERACQIHGITLRAKAAAPRDPCDTDPLSCQR